MSPKVAPNLLMDLSTQAAPAFRTSLQWPSEYSWSTLGNASRQDFFARQRKWASAIPFTKLAKSPGRRSTELAWRASHKNELRAYAGSWVVLEKDEVISTGETVQEAVNRAREAGIAVPYVFKVDTAEEEGFPSKGL